MSNMLGNEGCSNSEDISERFAAMRKQESTTYQCEDYLAHSFQALHQQGDDYTSKAVDLCFDVDEAGSNTSSLNEAWREKICEWSYQVVDHFDISRESVSVSISLLDRYLCTQPNVNKKLFQLAAMTCLQLATKLYEPAHRVLHIPNLMELSRGFFTVEHICAMERNILQALNWHVHPPTTMAFIRHLLVIIESHIPSKLTLPVIHTVLDSAQFLSELSICDYFFVPRKPSDIAAACILNAMETLTDTEMPVLARVQFANAARIIAGVDFASMEIHECRSRLQDMYFQGGYQQQNLHRPSVSREVTPDRKRHKNDSPVCVSDYQRS